jgi:TolB-like protein/Tfp pilus assembly protein PilF
VAGEKGVGLKGWLSGPGRKTPEPRGEKLVRLDKYRIAVLPMTNISPDPKDAYFAEGMTEELITVLSQLQGLRVIARTSVDRYSKREKSVAEIATELQVGSVMEGSVRMARDRIRVTVQLVSGESEEHLWSEMYDRKLDDIFEIQTDIAKQVARSLKVKLLHGEVERMESRAPVNTPAYSAYLKGRTLLVSRTEADLNAAKELFESAIALDSTYAPAYSGLADAFALLATYSTVVPFSIANQRARELVSKALEINPDLAEARATLGLLLAQEYDFAGAEKEFRRAISLNPSYSNAHLWLGHFVLAYQGRYRECLEELNMAELADPMSIAVLSDQLDWLLLYAGNIEQSAQKVAKANQLYPEHQLTREMNVFFHYNTGNYSRAIELTLKAIGVDEKPPVGGPPILLIMAYAAIGNPEEARKWLARMKMLPEGTRYRSGDLAYAYAGLGEKDEFFTWANQASKEKDMNFGFLRLIDKEIPAMRNIRQDPRFIELFKKVGLEA